MLTYLKQICSVIDKLLSDLNFEVLQQSEPGESGLSQALESHNLSELSNQEEADSQSSVRDITPDTSMSQKIEGGVFKKPRKRGPPS